MSKSTQITAIFAFLFFIIILVSETILLTLVDISIDLKNLFISFLPFSVILGVILNKVPIDVNEKLKYLNEKYLSHLLTWLYFISPDSDIILYKMKEYYEEITKYGKYHFMPCYPYLLMNDLNAFFKNAEKHNELILRLKQISRDKTSGRENVTILISLLGLTSRSLESYDKNLINRYKSSVIKYIKENESDLIIKLRKSIDEMRKIYNIVDNYESFFKENSLKMPELRTNQPSRI